MNNEARKVMSYWAQRPAGQTRRLCRWSLDRGEGQKIKKPFSQHEMCDFAFFVVSHVSRDRFWDLLILLESKLAQERPHVCPARRCIKNIFRVFSAVPAYLFKATVFFDFSCLSSAKASVP